MGSVIFLVANLQMYQRQQNCMGSINSVEDETKCRILCRIKDASSEVEFLNSEELSLIKSSPLPAQLPGRGGVNST